MSESLRDALPGPGQQSWNLEAFADAVDEKIAGGSDSDAIPPRWRTRVYLIGLVVAALVALVAGLAPIWFGPELADKVSATAYQIGTVAAFVLGGLGVAYRPTR